MANSSEYYYNKGLNFLNEENYDEALMYLDKAIDMEPDNLEYLNSKSICLYNLNLVDESIEYLDKILEINPDDESIRSMKAKVLATKAKELQDNNLTQESIEIWDEIVNINPNNAKYLNNKSQALFKHATRFEPSMVEKCNPHQIKSRILDSYHDELDYIKKFNDLKKSFELVNEATSMPEDNNPFLFEKKGKLYFKIGEYDNAIECFDKAIELNPKRKDRINKLKSSTYISKGDSLKIKCKYSDAIKCFDIAIEIDANNPNPWFSKGQCLYQCSKYEESIECFNRAYEIEKYPGILLTKTDSLIKLELFEEALDIFEELYKHNMITEIAYSKKKIGLLISLNKIDDAKKFANNSKYPLEIFVEEVEFLNKAIESIDSALKLEKNNDSFIINKKKCLYYKAKRMIEFSPRVAEAIIDELIELDSTNPLYWDLKGVALSKTINFPKTREYSTKALELMK